MKYLKCIWFHDNADYPILMYSEIDDNRNEKRKIEFYRNDRIGYAIAGLEKGGAALSIESIPSVKFINSQSEFYAMAISKNEFEIVWLDGTQKEL